MNILRKIFHRHTWTICHKSIICTVMISPGKWIPVNDIGWESNAPIASDYWTWKKCWCSAIANSDDTPNISVKDTWHQHSPDLFCMNIGTCKKSESGKEILLSLSRER